MPVLNKFHQLGISANQITVFSILLSLIIGVAFWFADSNPLLFLALPLGLFLRMALNALDGMMARVYNQQSKAGEVLNELGDIISDFFIYFPLLKHEAANLYLVIIFLSLTFINEFAGLLGKVVSQQRRYDGPMGKSDRAFLVGVYGLLATFNISITNYAVYIFFLINALLLVSTSLRVKRSLTHG